MTATRKFQPLFWHETYTRLTTAPGFGPVLPLALFGLLHRPVSAYCAGNTSAEYFPAASEPSEVSEESAQSVSESDSYHDECGYCGEHTSECGGCECGDCGYRVDECECCTDASGRRQSEEMAGHGSGEVRIVRGGEYGWRVKWAGDPQPSRDRSFRTEAKAEACKRAIETYMSQGEFLGAGRHRAGWLVGGLTVKVAMSEDGIKANTSEVTVSQSAPIPVPETAPLSDVAILAEFAPRLSRAEAYEVLNAPNSPFAGYWIDADDFGPQLGRLPCGKVVCFDFSDN